MISDTSNTLTSDISNNVDEYSQNINIILSQTNYDESTARDKLILFNNDYLLVIKDYLGIKISNRPKKTLNQEIYTEFRQFFEA